MACRHDRRRSGSTAFNHPTTLLIFREVAVVGPAASYDHPTQLNRDAPLKIARAKPLLGTLVEISVDGLDEERAHRAIDRGFAAVAEVHALMSFHDAASDVSRLNADGLFGVRVAPQTRTVLLRAQEIAELSDGLFDITTASHLVSWGFLPPPKSTHPPEPQASWRDIVIDDHVIRFSKPLWIDLGELPKVMLSIAQWPRWIFRRTFKQW